eukprot:15452407-Alexandrium_andersonii.AAC.1
MGSHSLTKPRIFDAFCVASNHSASWVSVVVSWSRVATVGCTWGEAWSLEALVGAEGFTPTLPEVLAPALRTTIVARRAKASTCLPEPLLAKTDAVVM